MARIMELKQVFRDARLYRCIFCAAAMFMGGGLRGETANELVQEKMRQAAENVQREEYESAIPQLTEVLLSQPDSVTALTLRGASLALKGDLTGALPDLNQALLLQPDNINVLTLRGAVHEQLKHIDEAMADYERAINLGYGTAAVFCGRGRLRSEKKDYVGADADFSRALERAPADVAAWKGRGSARLHAKNVEGALSDFTKALVYAPTDAGAFGLRGIAWRTQGDLGKAAADLTRAIELKPTDPNFYIERMIVRAKGKKYPQVLADGDKAIELGADGFDVWFLRGMALFRLRRLDDARNACDEALKRNGTSEGVRKKRAQVLRHLGETTASIAEYSAVLKIKADDADALSARGGAWAALGEFDKAYEDFSHALEGQENEYDRIFSFLLAKRLKKNGAADGFAEQVAGWKDDWPKTIGRFLTGEIDERELLAQAADIDQAKAREQRCEAYYYAGAMRLFQGNLNAAKMLFERCVQTDVWTFREYLAAKAELARMDAGAK